MAKMFMACSISVLVQGCLTEHHPSLVFANVPIQEWTIKPL